MTTSSFDLLCQELADFQASRAKQQARPARATAPRPLAKAAPVAAPKPPDFDRIARQQDEILEGMQKAQTLHVQDRIRTHIADLRKAARAGRLTAMDAAKLDVFVGQAAAMGLQP
jgi:hypothetical protein